jgi:hypothetical protein
MLSTAFHASIVSLGVAVFVTVTVGFIVPGYVAAEVGHPKGRLGWTWGLLLSWLGVFAVYVMPPVEK